MAYTPTYPSGWEDQPSTNTPINKIALDNIDQELVSVSGAVDGLTSDLSDLNTEVDTKVTGGAAVTQIVPITQAAYDLLSTPRDATILYIIVPE